jgi:hypothetical protein
MTERMKFKYDMPISLIARPLSPKLSPVRPEYPVSEHRIATGYEPGAATLSQAPY